MRPGTVPFHGLFNASEQVPGPHDASCCQRCIPLTWWIAFLQLIRLLDSLQVLQIVMKDELVLCLQICLHIKWHPLNDRLHTLDWSFDVSIVLVHGNGAWTNFRATDLNLKASQEHCDMYQAWILWAKKLLLKRLACNVSRFRIVRNWRRRLSADSVVIWASKDLVTKACNGTESHIISQFMHGADFQCQHHSIWTS